MSNYTQFVFKEVLHGLLSEYKPDLTGEPIAWLDYAQTSDLEHSATREEIRGGWSNALILSYNHSRTANINFTLPVIDFRVYAKVFGGEYIKRKLKLFQREVYTVRDGGQANYIVLKREPLDGTLFVNISENNIEGKKLEVSDRGNKNPNANSASIVIEQNEVRLYVNKTDTPKGTKLIVTYSYLPTSDRFSFLYGTSDKPKFFTFRGIAIGTNKETGEDVYFLVEIPKGSFSQDSNNLNLSATDATVLSLRFDMYGYKDEESGKDLYYRVVEYDEELGEGEIKVLNVVGDTITLKQNEKFVIATYEENVTIDSPASNNTKFTVKGNEITAVSQGTGKITLKKYGYKDKEITVTVTQ